MRNQVIGLCRTYPRSLAISGLILLAALATIAATPSGSSADLTVPGQGDRRVTLSVATLLQRLHLARQPLDDEKSKRCLDNFLKALDPLKSHFRQSDIEEFTRHEKTIDDEVRQGDVALAYTIFKRFMARVEERNQMIDKILDSDIDFSTEESLVTDRDVLTYPKTAQESYDRWRKRIKYDLLLQKADEVDLAEAKDKLRRRYSSYLKRMSQTDSDELLEMYLTSMSSGYDPHTSYMSASTLENFEIMMRLELDGIGASLQYEDGYTVCRKIIPGGAADKDGRLKIEDKIVSVGQGEDGEMVDVVDMKLSDVVALIRGKRDTYVRLGVLTADGGKQEIYNVKRARIELHDSEAQGELITDGVKSDGSPLRVGWIDLPSFYMDMSGARLGKTDFKSTTRDVKKLLEDFKAKGIDAVVLDLRGNGGGSLTEAVNLTGLFIESGPVVQVKGFGGEVEAYEDRDPTIDWDGPLVVLTDKFSASASEIFAGAIQDYQRGIIVGDKATHGKGTVQQLLDLGRQIFRIPNAPSLGALKITIQQFYRPDGDSTQNRGVLADLEWPSLTTHLDVGESDLDYALKFDQVAPAQHKSYDDINENLVQTLTALSQKRVSESDKFKKVVRNIDRYMEQKEKKSVDLNEERFLAERKELNLEKEQEKQLDELSDPTKPAIDRDHYFEEAVAITRDYVNLKHEKVAARRAR